MTIDRRRWEEAQVIALGVLCGLDDGARPPSVIRLAPDEPTAAELAGLRLPPARLSRIWIERWTGARVELMRRLLLRRRWPAMVVHLVTGEGLPLLRTILRGELEHQRGGRRPPPQGDPDALA